MTGSGALRRWRSMGAMTHDKVAAVTGASAGIGEASARALAADGWHVVVGARRFDRLQQIAQEIGGTAVALDVTCEESVARFAKQVERCDLLVNNAGGARGLDPVLEANMEDWRWMYETNVLGTVRVTTALKEKLLAARGHIIMMSSIAGITSYVGGGGYNAAKFGQSALTKALRLETPTTGLRITELNPGRVQTDFALNRFKGDEDKAQAVYADKLNLSAADIAEAVRWVASLPAHVNIDRMVITPTDQVF